MKLEEIRTSYEELAGEASKLSRQLAFAGICIVWIFKITIGDKTSIPDGLILPSLLLVLSLGLDVSQYLVQAATWYAYYWTKRKEGKKESDHISEPEWPNYFSWSIWLIKIVTMIAAYFFLFRYLFCLLIPNT